jgi:hypothetical protein
MLGLAWKVLVPVSLVNLLWVAIVLKLPVPVLVQWVLALGGNLVVLVGALTLLGRNAKQHVAGRRDGAGISQEVALLAKPSEGA